MTHFLKCAIVLMLFVGSVCGSPSLVIKPVADTPEGIHRIISEDESYKFAERGYGSQQHPLVPGLFVFSKQANRWAEITKVSTYGAKLGRSPTGQEGRFCPVGWDYSRLRSSAYADVPLLTSGSVNNPEEIIFDSKQQTYALRYNSYWKLDYVLTVFYIRQKDLDDAFE